MPSDWWYSGSPLTDEDARVMLTRILKDGELTDTGIKFKSCSVFRHWRSEIDLDGLMIVPEIEGVYNRRDFLRKKFLPLTPEMVTKIRKLLTL